MNYDARNHELKKRSPRSLHVHGDLLLYTSSHHVLNYSYKKLEILFLISLNNHHKGTFEREDINHNKMCVSRHLPVSLKVETVWERVVRIGFNCTYSRLYITPSSSYWVQE